MAIFAFGVSAWGIYLSIRIYPSFKIANEESECPESTWHNRINEDPLLDINEKKNYYYLALVNDKWFNFSFVLVSLNKKIASVKQGNSWLYLERN